MSWKAVLSFVLVLIVIVILLVYWVFPYNQIEFGFSDPGHSNFTLNSSLGDSMQFYENMRYPNSDISYRIDDCPLGKKDEMERAINYVEASTVLNFYEVSSNEEISITCDDEIKHTGELFVAGEGGVTNVTITNNFNVILKGEVLLLRESECSTPIVGTHELLHALGFDHSDNRNNIMYPTVRCDQTIGEDTINFINTIYSYPTQPDLSFEEASASISGRYLDVTMTIRNNGLAQTEESKVIVYGDGKSLKEFDIEPIGIGQGKIITLTNILVLQTSVDEIQLSLEYDPEELRKDNNQITLEIKN